MEIKYKIYKNDDDLNLIKTTTLNNYIELISQSHPDFTILEHLPNIAKLFFIVEVPFEQLNLIYNIINDFIEFMKTKHNIQINNYVLLFNIKKLHYRVIFYEYYTNIDNICEYIKRFTFNNPEYIDYVYNVQQPIILCAVNQFGIVDSILDNKPLINPETNEQYFNKHILINGSIEDSILQNINNSKALPEIEIEKRDWNMFDDIQNH